MYLEIGWEDADIIRLAQDRVHMWDLVNTIVGFLIQLKAGNFLSS
jgi:hypothetical protein